MEELLAVLGEINDEIDYNKEKHLVDDGLFVSFDIIQCVSECEERFDIEIPPEAIVAENFQSADTIWQMIERLQKG